MKKIILAVLAIIASFSTANAQAEFGIKGGYNYSYLSLSKNYYSSTGGLNSYHFGVFVEIGGESYAVQPELIYSKHGNVTYVEVNQGVIHYQEEIRSRLNYIKVPIMFKFGSVGSDKSGASIDFGPYMGFMSGVKIRKKETFSVRDETRVNEKTTDKSYGYKFFDYGLSVGFTIKAEHFSIITRYNHGLRNISTRDISKKNRVFEIGIGYQFE